jgi:SAM-dependent methyltransferase
VVELDASLPLPFAFEVFDLVLIVDFVFPPLLAGIARHIRPGGQLVCETMSARGGNWRDLPEPGESHRILHEHFEIFESAAAPAGPTKSEAETVKLVAKRR